jgi:PAS domain-containing protein
MIVSGTIGEDMAVAALKAGANDFIAKGNLSRLLPAVERELRDAGERRGRRQAEVALQASERRFRSLIENMAGLIAVLDATGTLCYNSPSMELMLGYQLEELLGRCLDDFVHPEDLREFRRTVQKSLRQPDSLVPIVMPGMNGHELAERVGHEWPRMHVLLMSGYTDDDVVRHGVCNAEIAFIPKPFKPAELACKVREVLGT